MNQRDCDAAPAATRNSTMIMIFACPLFKLLNVNGTISRKSQANSFFEKSNSVLALNQSASGRARPRTNLHSTSATFWETNAKGEKKAAASGLYRISREPHKSVPGESKLHQHPGMLERQNASQGAYISESKRLLR